MDSLILQTIDLIIMVYKESRKRKYRHRVRCEACHKEINSDNKENHITTKHSGQRVQFTLLQEKGQKKICLEQFSSTNITLKVQSNEENNKSGVETSKNSTYENSVATSNQPYSADSLPETSKN